MPELKIRVVNVVDLMCLPPKEVHPHGLEKLKFRSLFTDDKPVIFAFHGYVPVIHDLIHGRPEPERFHVRGYMEEGTTTTPFDMVVLNKMSRFHLAMEALRRSDIADQEKVATLTELFQQKLELHDRYIQSHGTDLPEIENWKWQHEMIP